VSGSEDALPGFGLITGPLARSLNPQPREVSALDVPSTWGRGCVPYLTEVAMPKPKTERTPTDRAPFCKVCQNRHRLSEPHNFKRKPK